VHPLLDEHCATHGNWVGLRVGWVTVLWLLPILSDPRSRGEVEPHDFSSRGETR
jgi:hypothetical protein